jgi:quercetin dioxygenase-like cupin family protein
MGEPHVVAPRAGEIIGDAPDRRVEILSDHDTVHATWSRFAPGREGADLHVHRHHSDLFYVLAGELTLRLGVAGDEIRMPAGTLARMPPLVVHGFRNGGDAEVRYLNLHAPGRGFADYMRALRDGAPISYDQEEPPADGGRPPSDAVVGADAIAAAELPGLRLRLLADVEEIAVADVSETRDAERTAQHVHRRHAESIYVLDGELALLAGDRELRAPAGSWLQLAAGAAHSDPIPGGPGPLRYLAVHTPSAGFGDFVRELAGGDDERAALADSGFDQQPAV